MQGIVKDGINSLLRYYYNNFCDGTKQVGLLPLMLSLPFFFLSFSCEIFHCHFFPSLPIHMWVTCLASFYMKKISATLSADNFIFWWKSWRMQLTSCKDITLSPSAKIWHHHLKREDLRLLLWVKPRCPVILLQKKRRKKKDVQYNFS